MIVQYDVTAGALGQNPLSMQRGTISPWGAVVSGEIIAPLGHTVNLRGAVIDVTLTADGVQRWAGSYPISGQLISSDQRGLFSKRVSWGPGQAIRLDVHVTGPGGDHSGAWEFVAPVPEEG